MSTFEDKDAFAVMKVNHDEVASLHFLHRRLHELKLHLEQVSLSICIDSKSNFE